jgi:diguanylate cyclase (GGDEF)-like protein
VTAALSKSQNQKQDRLRMPTEPEYAAPEIVRRLVLAGMTVALSMLVLGAIMLYGARQDAWRQAQLASNNLALALERDITRNIAVYDLSLQGAVDALEQPGIDQVSPAIRQSAVFDRAASAEYLGSLLVLDQTGAIIADSTSAAPHDLNFADRDYFKIHQQQPEAGLFVSRPFHSRLRGGDASMAISRRISGKDGSFRGVVVGTLRLAYFKELFGKLDLGAQGAVMLMQPNGHVIARMPAGTDDANLDLSKSQVVQQFKTSPSGEFTAISVVDGVSRLIIYRQIGTLPLLLSVATATDEIYASWWQKATFIGSILVVLCAATIALSLLFRQEMLRRVEAETRLSIMAATDGLTGLANRRAFELGLAQEWKRAVRGHTPVGLLMIDADYFKRINDRYGHPEGDRILQGIAAAIRTCVRRPADLAARFGGEEFVVLLPETDAAGALAIAERIRAAVAALDVAGSGPTGDQVTVNIGVAVAYSDAGQTDALLLKEADAALYAAKRHGRNRVVLAEASTPPLVELPILRTTKSHAG